MAIKTIPRSLAALGQTTLSSRERLNNAGIHDPELIMAGLWADANKPDLNNFGILPVQLIAHQCTKNCRGGEHAYSKLEPRDVQIVSAAVQWLATDVGRAFYTKFLQELGVTLEYRPDAASARKVAREKKHAPR